MIEPSNEQNVEFNSLRSTFYTYCFIRSSIMSEELGEICFTTKVCNTFSIFSSLSVILIISIFSLFIESSLTISNPYFLFFSL